MRIPSRTGLLAAVVIVAMSANCSKSTEPGAPLVRVPGDVTFRAQASVVPDERPLVRVVVEVTNVSDTAVVVQLLGGNCAVLLRAYRTTDRSGRPDWDQTINPTCQEPLMLLQLQPGQARTFESVVDMTEFFSHAAPSGRYYLTAVIRVIEQDGTGYPVAIAAGDVDW